MDQLLQFTFGTATGCGVLTGLLFLFDKEYRWAVNVFVACGVSITIMYMVWGV